MRVSVKITGSMFRYMWRMLVDIHTYMIVVHRMPPHKTYREHKAVSCIMSYPLNGESWRTLSTMCFLSSSYYFHYHSKTHPCLCSQVLKIFMLWRTNLNWNQLNRRLEPRQGQPRQQLPSLSPSLSLSLSTHTHRHTCMHACIHTHMHMHTHIRTHTHTHTLTALRHWSSYIWNNLAQSWTL